MSSITLVFSSSRVKTLGELPAGARGVIVEVTSAHTGRTDRLLSLGVTPGARIVVLQTFPGVVFLCDQTELAVERSVARSVIVQLEKSSVAGRTPQVTRPQTDDSTDDL